MGFLLFVWGIVVAVVLHPLFALLFGTLLAVMVPYARAVLQRVAEKGSWRELGMPFDWRYLALFLLPLLEGVVAIFTTQGLWGVLSSWTWAYAAMLGYTGGDIAKEITKAGAALQRVISFSYGRGPARP